MTLLTIDTNVLLRYLAADDPEHSPLARRLIDEADDEGGQLLVTIPVVCELTWLLRSRRYGLDRSAIAEVWQRLLDSERFRFQARSPLVRALEQFRLGSGDLSDCLIQQLGADEGAAEVVTFDGGFARADGVRLLG